MSARGTDKDGVGMRGGAWGKPYRFKFKVLGVKEVYSSCLMLFVEKGGVGRDGARPYEGRVG